MKKKKVKKKTAMKGKFCPQCGHTKVVFEVGGQMGIYKCNSCGYRSPIFPEKDIGKKLEIINFQAIERRWQQEWEKRKAFQVKEKKGKKKFYVLEMFPYPSGEGLHMGHAFNYTVGDIYARFMRMNNYNVLYPMGYDSLGLPAENAAIQAKVHPKKYTEKAIANFIRQQKELGLSYDWSRVVMTHDPQYYIWDQWIFLQMLKKGLAYRKRAPVNFCPKCNTVLANEQVKDGKCWRHEDTEVQIKELEQWFFKITDYASELYDDIDKLKDWAEDVKIMQKNWIGKSHGINVNFTIDGKKWPIFTTRIDTIFGVTFMVISAQHPKLKELVKGTKQEKQVMNFAKKVSSIKQADLDKMDKEGVFTGKYAINSVNKEKVPVWVGNFVLAEYGSGMVMAVPAHDQRDLEFAKKYKIPIRIVIQPKNKNCIVVHGCPSNNENDPKKRTYDKHWIPWIKKQLEKKGIKTSTPLMHTPWKPKYEEWKKEFEKNVINENTILIGHSCGSAFIVRWLGETKRNINKLILVAPWKIPEPKDPRKTLYGYTVDPTIKSRVKEIIIFTADNEEKNGKLSAKIFHEALGGNVIKLKKRGHYTLGDMGTKEFPELLKVITEMKEAYIEPGILVNSGKFNGMYSPKAITEISKWLEKQKKGKRVTQYRLRDWLISRQRYWGTPIPVIYCDKCGIVPIPEKNLPVKLPEKVKFGKGNPLTTSKQFVNVKCPKCKAKARRETDTMDTFVNSSWYFLRYCDPQNKKKIFAKDKVKYWMPVDQYIGGKEHSTGHLIYFRFYTKFLRDLKLLNFSEPAPKLFNQGMLHGIDGAVMSKSRGNIVLPDEVSKKYGIDTARLFLVSTASPDKDVMWSEEGIQGAMRFIKRVMSFFSNLKFGKTNPRLESKVNKIIKEVSQDIKEFRYNLAVIKIRALFDYFETIDKKTAETFLKILHPFCPHITEELWHKWNKNLISLETWPKCDEKKIKEQFEKEEQAQEKLKEDIRHIIRIISKKPKAIYIYVIPKELKTYEFTINDITKEFACKVDVQASNKVTHDPQKKARKAKPGKPAIYVE